MKQLIVFIIITLVLLPACTKQFNTGKGEKNAEFGLVIHGGAGNIIKSNFTPEQEAEYNAKLSEALETGYKMLEEGKKSLEVVEAVVRILEDSPLFNAGKGAVFTAEGKNELDAALMDGATLKAGSVAGVTHIKNPVSLARLVMEKSPHVMMVGAGAEKFAKSFPEIEFVDSSYFYTEKSWKALMRAKEKEGTNVDQKMGTVGCAALDRDGNLAAATSTGGMTNKKFGRVGDCPIIGAGTYANNKTCAISATGHGEYFIRNVVAYDISSLIDYKNLSLKDAASRVVMEKLKHQKGEGGVIGIDKNGNVVMTFNSAGMFRGYKLNNGEKVVKLFAD